MENVDVKLLEELGHHAERLSFKQLDDAFDADKNPNKGTREDYVNRKLADGWRREADGEGIYRIVNATGGVTNTPDASVYGDPKAENPVPNTDPDPNSTPEDQALAEQKRRADEEALAAEAARADEAYQRNTQPLGVKQDVLSEEDPPPAKTGWFGTK